MPILKINTDCTAGKNITQPKKYYHSDNPLPNKTNIMLHQGKIKTGTALEQ